MEPIIKIDPDCFAGYTGTATVVQVEAQAGWATVSIDTPGGPRPAQAWLLRALSGELATGDKVLVAADHCNDVYVIGALSAKPRDHSESKIRLSDGTHASVFKTESQEKLCIFSQTNALIFEYDARTGKANISTNASNVAFHAPNGNIDFNAANHIRFTGDRIELAGRSGISFSVGKVFERLKTSLLIKPGKVDLSGQTLRVAAKQADFYAEEVTHNVKRLVSRIGHARFVVEKLETLAGTIIEKAKTAYRSTEGLSQQSAGRIRMLIASTFYLKSKTSVLKSDEDVKVKAEKIHLG